MNADRAERLEKKREKKKGCFHTFYLPVFISPVPFSPPPAPPPSPPIIPSSPSSPRCAQLCSPHHSPHHSALPPHSSFLLHFLPFLLFILSFLFPLFCPPSHAAPLNPPLHPPLHPHLFFRNISIEKGLSQNSILSIARDQFGFLWFGTESGLNKFDGYGFTVYVPLESNPSSLSNSWINTLLVDRYGDIWVGTENGLNRYIYSRDRFERYLSDPADPASISSSRICLLYTSPSPRD